MSEATANLLCQSALAAALIAGVLIYGRLKDWGPVARVLVAAAPLFGALALGEFAVNWLTAPDLRWNSARLAIAFAARLGFPMYAGPEAGALLGQVYGPGLAWAYLPATLFPLPSQAIYAGCLLSILYCLLPAARVLWRADTEPDLRRTLWGAGMVWLALLCAHDPALRYVTFSIHADAPALAWSAAACLLLPDKRPSGVWRGFVLSGLCAALAVWTKQTAVGILPALPAYVWLTQGGRAGGRMLLCVAGWMLGLGMAFALSFGGREMFFSMVAVPGGHPWVAGVDNETAIAGDALARARAVASAAGQMLRFGWLPLTVLCLRGLFLWIGAGKGGWSAAWGSKQRWGLFVWVGLWMLPLGLMGRVKVGGDYNSLAYPLYFFALASGLALQEHLVALRTLRFAGRQWQAAGAALLLALVTAWKVEAAGRFAPRRLATRVIKLEDQAVEYLRRHPGELYFPWQPLVHLMGEGRLRHFEDGIYAVRLAGFPVSEERFRAHVPERLRAVALTTESEMGVVREYLPDFTRPAPDAELRYWILLAREP